jgi:site-specific recombinase XerD
MTRRLLAALGTIQTPHGAVIVRKFWVERRSTFAFQFDGPHLALRWMLPKWAPTTTSTKTQATPPTPITTVEEVDAAFSGMQSAWQQRMQALGNLTPSTLPSGAPAPYQTLAQLRDLVDAEVASSLRASTVATYRHQWKGILARIPDTTAVATIDRTMIQESVAEMSAAGLAPATVRRNIESLGRLLTRAVDDGVLSANPVAKVRLPRSAKRVPRFLTQEQRCALLAAAEAHSRDAYLLIALAVLLGLRKAELGALRWEHVDLQQKIVHIVNDEHFTTKNAKNRAVPICEELLAILTPHAKATGFVLKPRLVYKPKQRYRWEFKNLFDVLIAEADLPDWVTPHVLRHTFASLAAQAGVSLFKIGAWMGHSMTEVTEIYAHLAAYDADINKIVGPGPNEATITGPTLKLVK